MRVNKKTLENYIGKKVEIKTFDGEIIVGVLHKTGEEKYKGNNALYIPRNYYFVEYPFSNNHSCLFRSSHVTKIQEVIY